MEARTTMTTPGGRLALIGLSCAIFPGKAQSSSKWMSFYNPARARTQGPSPLKCTHKLRYDIIAQNFRRSCRHNVNPLLPFSSVFLQRLNPSLLCVWLILFFLSRHALIYGEKTSRETPPETFKPAGRRVRWPISLFIAPFYFCSVAQKKRRIQQHKGKPINSRLVTARMFHLKCYHHVRSGILIPRRLLARPLTGLFFLYIFYDIFG